MLDSITHYYSPLLPLQVIMIANDVTVQSGSFGVQEDDFFFKASVYARERGTAQHSPLFLTLLSAMIQVHSNVHPVAYPPLSSFLAGIPRVFISCNSGARIGLVDELKPKFKVRADDPRPRLVILFLTLASHTSYAAFEFCLDVSCPPSHHLHHCLSCPRLLLLGGLEGRVKPLPRVRVPVPLRRGLHRFTPGHCRRSGRIRQALGRDEMAARGHHRPDTRHRSRESQVQKYS